MAPPDRGGTQDESAKHALDRIGKQIQQKAHDDALPYQNGLYGLLSKATFRNGNKFDHPDSEICKLDHRYHTNVTTNVINPCADRSDVRFSDVHGGQCTRNRIKDSKSDIVGACAPYRRLHVCDKNLEQIEPIKITNTHNLLADVCLAAKFEGESFYKHLENNPDSNYKPDMCTVLARSFADIGDIVRGKDLYLGDKQEKDNLQNNLKRIFKNIYENLKDNEAVKTRYDNDEKDGNFYQLREDWWALNRKDVWKAITCNAPDNSKYFRHACSDDMNPTHEKCRCVTNDVPTNLDYVPQYLRWFDEWTEDFCRKRKLKLPNVKKFCRGDYDGEKFCSFNGYDCEETINKIGKLVIGKGCPKCSVACRLYESWITNQKKEFEKQRKKYAREISNSGRQKRSTNNNIYKGYDTQFYEKLQDKYSSVEMFLELLNNEKECTNIDDKEGKIDFTKTDDDKGTFSRSTYCQRCPECGVVCDGNKCTERKKNDPECSKASTYNRPPNIVPTKINVLYSGEESNDIIKKLEEFCRDPSKKHGAKNEQWECYFKDSTENKCKVMNDQNVTEHDKIMTFDDFFQFWVAHLLSDTIDWRTQLIKCLNDIKLKKCEKGCNKNCECFKEWINKKKEEWEQLKKHFEEQKDFNGFDPYETLENVLEIEFLPIIKDAYGELNSIEEMKKIIEKNRRNLSRTKDDEDAIDILLKHENDDAKECTQTHKDEKCKKPEDPGRSLNPHEEYHEYDDSSDEDEEEEEHDEVHDNPCAQPSGVHPTKPVKQIAREMHQAAHQKMETNTRGSSLKGKAHEGKYKRNGKTDALRHDICKITIQHSNDGRTSGEPCTGKGNGTGRDTRFEIGTLWGEYDHEVNPYHKGVLFPPRRRHMCTSNLEKLDVISVTNSNNVNHSFLGDVLLAVNYEAKKIIDMYKKKNNLNGPNVQINRNDQTTICRAMKYSFADIGDIIRGRDLWENNNDMVNLETNLKSIFGKIKDTLKNKYTKEVSPYTQLRSDWWEANRSQIWEAMKCAITNSGISCEYGIPPDDYIPQRLRWMTEWAEWYCKAQKKEYMELEEKCGECRNDDSGAHNVKCLESSQECTDCRTKCDSYKNIIQKWENQWEAQRKKYEELYKKSNSVGTATGVDENEKTLLQFLKNLKDGNSGNKRYDTAEGYVHEVLQDMECNTQKYFCKNPSRTDNNKQYAFEKTPSDYVEACKCKDRPAPRPPQPAAPTQSACEIAEEILKAEAGKNYSDMCNDKFKNGKYPGWNCTNKIKPGNDGACMPPRRQKLYLKKLQTFNGQKPDDLRKAFIECAAIETFFAWYKYKADKKKEKQEENEEALYGIGGEVISTDEELKKDLENGKIPYEFKRQMFYTFGDYKDIFFGKNIGDDVNEVEKNIKNVFPNSDTPNDQDNKNWWEKYAKDIWEGMLCGLSYASGTEKDKDRTQLTTTYNYNNVKCTSKSDKNDTPLSDFVTVPQFLRWFQEWSEEFCRRKKIILEKIERECRSDRDGKRYCSGDGHDCEKSDLSRYNTFIDLHCRGCEKPCTNYKIWIKNKEKEFDKQKNKCEREFNNYLKKDYSSVENFLASLNKGKVCRDNKDKNNKIEFNNNRETFGPSQYCKACPVYGVTCNKKNQKCESISEDAYKGIKGISGENKNDTNPTIIDVLVLGRKGTADDKYDNRVCKNTGIFEDSSLQKWICQKKYGVDQCIIENFADIDIDKDIHFNAFFQRWLRYFVQDYNKLKDKIKPCIKKENGIGNTCIEGCNNKCECVEEWLDKKFTEWGKIKQHYKKHSNFVNESIPHWVMSYFQQGPFDSYAEEAKMVVEGEDEKKRDELWGCTGPNYCDDKKKKDDDLITNLISKLNEKINDCKEKHNETKTNCVKSPPNELPDEDDENYDEYEESPDTKSAAPEFCKFDDTTNEPAPTTPKVPDATKPEDSKEEEKDKGDDEATKPGQNDTSNQGPEEEIPAPPDGEEVPKEVVPDKEVPVPPQKKTESKKKRPPLKPPTNEYKLTDVLLPTAFPLSVGIAFASLTYLLLKKKTKSTIDLLRIIDIPKGDYDMPTMKSSNRYIPYASHRYKGKTYIYMEGDSDSGHYYEDTTDITSSESEYEELDINDIYVSGSPKYKTLIEVVLEPSKRDIPSDKQSDIPPHTQSDMPNGNASINKFTDNEWNKLKQNFISQYLQNIQKDLPNENIIHDNMYKDTQLDDHILYDSMEEKPFITSIHDRDLHNGEEYNYNINFHVPENMSDSTNSMDDPISGENDSYSGIDLINDSLNNDQYVNIYDELLKRKENELFGTNHTKHTTGSKRVAAQTHTDPIINQLNMFHKWLDRHRNMCEQWNQNKKEELLDKLNEEWNKENKNNSNVTDTNGENNITRVLNSDVSIQIDMNSKPI
ncbi:erythrocyte membrane protein 1, PfEMP1, putative [Plasmodium sp. gorilla clade G1]|nr:erythrocyte membrane protein 1, PfEMP1, putative [Plasmodium sp. gorilla clade G1]